MAKEKSAEKLAILTAENEQALEILQNAIAPASVIFSDDEVKKAFKGNVAGVVNVMLKKHKSELIDLLAACSGVSRNEYHATLPKIMADGMQILSDKDLLGFFTQQG